MEKFDLDDKSLVIVAVLVLGILSMFFLDNPENLIGQMVTGLFGVAVGKSLSKLI